MRRIALGILVVSQLLFAAPAPAADDRDAQTSAVRNGRFVDGKAGPWLTTRPEVTITRLQQPVGSANFAVHFAGGATKMRRLLYRGDVSVEPGMHYELSFRYRCPAGSGIKARFRTAGKSFETKLPLSAEWQPGQLGIPVPPDAKAGILDFYYLPGQKGETWLTDIAMTLKGDAGYRTTAEWTRDYIRHMTPLGWTVTESPEHFALSKGLVTEYVKRDQSRLLHADWCKSKLLGRERQRLNHHFEQVPVGLYFYVSKNLAVAHERGQNWRRTFRDVFRRLHENHLNTVYVGNTYWQEERDGVNELEGMTILLDLADRFGIKVIAQMSSTYFRPKDTLAKTREYWEANSLPAAERLFAALDRHPALLAWSFKEEVAFKHAPWLSEYYRDLHAISFHKPVYLCCNHIKSARYAVDPAPEISAFDRYFFKYVCYLSYLRPPRAAFAEMIRAIKQFYQASQDSGNPFVYVGAACASHAYQADADADSQDYVLEENRGWHRDPKTGLWNGCMRYYPPPGGMRAQGWTGIALGAKGIICWLYGSPPGPPVPLRPRKQFDNNPFGIGADATGREPPQMEEYGRFAREIQALAPFTLHMNKRVVNMASCDLEEVLVTTHAMEGGGEKIVAVVNLHLGTVGGKSPTRLMPKDELSVDFNTGQLVGFKLAVPRDIPVHIPSAAHIYDLKNDRPLDVEEGRVILPLEPGEGTLLLLGGTDGADRIRRRNSVETERGSKKSPWWPFRRRRRH